LTRVSPDLDPPSDDVDGAQQSCFWPYVGGKPFLFHHVGIDVDGNPVDMSLPIIFVGKEINDLVAQVSLDEVVTAYADHPERARVDLHGQKVAFAESEAPDDTAFSVASLTFAGVLPDNYKNHSKTEPRFVPIVTEAEVNIPSLQVLGGTNAASAVKYADAYLENGFGGTNAGDVFLSAASGSATQVEFSKKSDRSGGFVAPDLSLSAVPRSAGPVSGDLGTIAKGSFDPSAFFATLGGAKLFGAISLSDLIGSTDPPSGQKPSQLQQLPRFAGQSLNAVEQL